MATAKRSRKKVAPEPPERLIEAALRLAALQGWTATTMAEIAAEAGVTLAEARRAFASKEALLAAFFKRLDAAMLEGLEPGGDEPVRDRLFDVIMRRFDAMAPYKDGIRAVVRDLVRQPPVLACVAAGPVRRSLEWMLTGAGVDSWGPLQPLQLKGLGLVYLAALRAWFRDDSADLAATMAALDKGLARAEAVLAMLPGVSRRGTEAAAESES
ncbi:MAG: helix-turn-helix domain-containing protein [Alphaproteobacteria bacterium]|jgi:AcrR family transcriptional regulator|nr:helix-turn-helix domain-containing protein [Alphaproteobacteria bacterium]